MSGRAPFSVPTLAALPRVIHAFSGALRTAEDHARFAADAGLGGTAVLRLRQVHGAEVIRAEDAARAPGPCAGDALVAASPGMALGIATADCVPILLADPDAGVVGAVHAGWRGMRARILARTLEAMTALGAEPARMRAAIGPAVQGGCYEVGPEVRSEFERAFPGAAALFTGRLLDLVAAARAELTRGGVPAAGLAAVALCTHCEPGLASHRREGAARGTNLAVIALRNGA